MRESGVPGRSDGGLQPYCPSGFTGAVRGEGRMQPARREKRFFIFRLYNIETGGIYQW